MTAMFTVKPQLGTPAVNHYRLEVLSRSMVKVKVKVKADIKSKINVKKTR